MRQSTRFLTVHGLLQLSSALMALMLAACNLPAHNNTLIFGTSKDVGLSVSSPSATDSSVSISIGYKDRSAAWVPLWANANTGGNGDKEARDCVTEKTVAVPTEELPPAKQAENGAEKKSPTDKKNDVKCRISSKFVAADKHSDSTDLYDAYSTFASFGGSVGATANASGTAVASGNLTLASFFATGVAAQNLSKHGAGLVSVGQNGFKPESNEPSAAAKNAQKHLQKFFELTADKNDKGDATYKQCLTKLSVTFDAAEPRRFEWLSGRKPADAAALIVDNYAALGDEKFRELDGIAFRKIATYESLFEKKKADLDKATPKETEIDKKSRTYARDGDVESKVEGACSL